MKITSTEKKVTLEINGEQNTFPLNYLGYQKTTDSITFIRGKQSLFTTAIIKIVVNGKPATTENVHELLDPLFKLGNGSSVTLPIEIANVNGLNDKLTQKADLGDDGKVSASQLPTYVDSIIEGNLLSETEFEFENVVITPDHNKIYVDLTSNNTFRWSGSQYTEISKSITLGETSSTAFAGDRGKVALEHSILTSGNPHKVTKTDVGLSNVDNTADEDKPLSKYQKEAIDRGIANRNYLTQSRFDNIDNKNASNWRTLDGNLSILNDSKFGNVVQWERISGEGEYQWNSDSFNEKPLLNTDLVYSVVAKQISSDGEFHLGMYTTNRHLDSNNANKIDLGDGWFIYWTTFFSENSITDNDTFGIHSIIGTWQFYSAGVYRGTKPIDWTPAPEDLDSKIDSIQIGGRNYILDSRDLFLDLTNIKNEHVNKTYRISSEFIKKCRNKHVTISADIEGTFKSRTPTYHYGVDVRIIYTDDTYTWVSLTEDTGINDGLNIPLKRYSATVKIEDKDIREITDLNIFIYNVDIVFYRLHNINIELSNKASDWTPAPEDLDSKIDSIEIGGRNMLLNSSFNSRTYGWGSSGNHQFSLSNDIPSVSTNISGLVTSNGTGDGGNSIIQSLSTNPPIEGRIYTISFLAKSTTSSSLHFELHGGSGFVDFNLDPNWKYYTHTFTYSSASDKVLYLFLLSSGDALINSPKLEEGSLATSWSLNPTEYKGTSIYRGNISNDYVDHTYLESNQNGFYNYDNGTYDIARSGYSDLLVKFNGTGSTSGLELMTNYEGQSPLYFRKIIDGNRHSASWKKILTEYELDVTSIPKTINYSLDEQFSGKKWIDGKNIYQKTIKIEKTNMSVLYTKHNIPNINSIIDYKGIFKREGDSDWYTRGYSDTMGTSYKIDYHVSLTDVFISCNGNKNFDDNYITIYYTCTDR